MRPRGAQREPGVAWHVIAGVVLGAAGVINMWGWFSVDLLPPYDFAGYAAVAEDVHQSLARYGRLPVWSSKWFAGTTRFLGSIKEVLAVPFVAWLGPVRGTEATILVLKVLAGLAMYAWCVRAFRAPVVGVIAGYAFAFGNAGNYASEHFHVVVSYLIVALVCVAGAELFQSRRPVWAVILGALVALQVINNPVHVPACVLLVSLLLVLDPWRGGGTRGGSVAATASVAALLGLAVAVCAVLASSQLAWLVADRAHHPMHAEDYARWGATIFIEHSPFTYVNRSNWLRPWLSAHHPPDMPLFPEDPARLERHYLGIVVMLVSLVGWYGARHERHLRRWSQVFAVLFVVQYWLSLGSRTLAWLLLRTFHWPETVDRPVHLALTIASVLALAWAGVVLVRWRRDRSRDAHHDADTEAGVPSRGELGIGLALVCWLASHSLFDALRMVAPPFRGLRAPGHFFELAPFAFYGLFAVSLVAIERRVRGGTTARRVLLALVAGMVVLDFWPGTRCFSRGVSMGPVRELRDELRRLPADAGGLRVALLPWSPPVWSSPTMWTSSSLAVSSAQVGGAWSWLPWQSTTHWMTYVRAALLWLADDLGPGERRIYRPVGDALGQIGRFRYFVDEFHGDRRLDLGTPWSRRFENGRFALWERQRVMPAAYGYRSYVTLVGADDLTAARAVSLAFADDVLTVAGAYPVAGGAATGAARVLLFGDAARTDARRERPARSSVVAEGQLVAAWPEILRAVRAVSPAPTPLVDVEYRRSVPERITLEIDAGGQSAVIFIAEAHHPWWRATVDAEEAPIFRAQMAFMAVPVEAGSHEVELRFTPPFVVRAADRLTASGWLILGVGAVGLMVRGMVRRRS